MLTVGEWRLVPADGDRESGENPLRTRHCNW